MPVYVPSTSSPHNDPRKGGGIFDYTRAGNPFRDWSAVFVSYCTGDVHIGARRVRYGAGRGKFAIEHKGYVNAMAALRWTFRNYRSAKSVLVAGSSAGAIAAPFFAGAVAKHYPAARISVLADAAGAYRAQALPAIFASWGVEDIAPKWIKARGALPLNIETFFKVNATAFPKIPQAQHNAVADAVQSLFLKLLGEAPDAEPALRANLAELKRDIPTFRTYLAAGTSHTALRDERFFATTAEGMPLWRWVADFVDDRSVEDIDCRDDAKGCAVAGE